MDELEAVRRLISAASDEVGWAALARETGLQEAALARFGAGKTHRPRPDAWELITRLLNRAGVPKPFAQHVSDGAVHPDAISAIQIVVARAELERAALEGPTGAHRGGRNTAIADQASSVEAGYVEQLRHAATELNDFVAAATDATEQAERRAAAYLALSTLVSLAWQWSTSRAGLIERAELLREFSEVVTFTVDEIRLPRPPMETAIDSLGYQIRVDSGMFSVHGGGSDHGHRHVFWYGKNHEVLVMIRCVPPAGSGSHEPAATPRVSQPRK